MDFRNLTDLRWRINQMTFRRNQLNTYTQSAARWGSDQTEPELMPVRSHWHSLWVSQTMTVLPSIRMVLDPPQTGFTL
jgi:hypothetical protein